MNGDIREMVVVGDWTILISIAALTLSAIQIFTRVIDKSLSIREHEAYKSAIERDIARIENRILHLEQSRPTTGELQVLAEGFNKRLDETRRS